MPNGIKESTIRGKGASGQHEKEEPEKEAPGLDHQESDAPDWAIGGGG